MNCKGRVKVKIIHLNGPIGCSYTHLILECARQIAAVGIATGSSNMLQRVIGMFLHEALGLLYAEVG